MDFKYYFELMRRNPECLFLAYDKYTINADNVRALCAGRKVDFDSLLTEAETIMTKKRTEYSSPEDTFRNFNEGSRLMGFKHSPIDVLHMYALKHVESFIAIRDGKVQDNLPKEKLKDVIIDLINYMVLHHAYLYNRKEDAKDFIAKLQEPIAKKKEKK